MRPGSWAEKGSGPGGRKLGNKGKYLQGIKSHRCEEANRRDLFSVIPSLNWE